MLPYTQPDLYGQQIQQVSSADPLGAKYAGAYGLTGEDFTSALEERRRQRQAAMATQMAMSGTQMATVDEGTPLWAQTALAGVPSAGAAAGLVASGGNPAGAIGGSVAGTIGAKALEQSLFGGSQRQAVARPTARTGLPPEEDEDVMKKKLLAMGLSAGGMALGSTFGGPVGGAIGGGIGSMAGTALGGLF